MNMEASLDETEFYYGFKKVLSKELKHDIQSRLLDKPNTIPASNKYSVVANVSTLSEQTIPSLFTASKDCVKEKGTNEYDGRDKIIDVNKCGSLILRNHPEYIKFWKMLEVGVPIEAVKYSCLNGGKDPSVLDLNPEETLALQTRLSKKSYCESDLSPKYNPKYAMVRKCIRLKALRSQTKRDEKNDANHDSLRETYWKIPNNGPPIEATKQLCVRQLKNNIIVDLDPEKSLASQLGQNKKFDTTEKTVYLLKYDPEYTKYWKMLAVGVPIGAVKNCCIRDGKDPSIMDLDLEKVLQSQTKRDEKSDANDDSTLPLQHDPEYAIYWKMRKIGLPIEAAKQLCVRDGKNPFIMDLDPEKPFALQCGRDKKCDTIKKVISLLKYNPEYNKYWKMLAVGVPIGAVKNCCIRDGKDLSIIDLDPEKTLISQTRCDEKPYENDDSGLPLKYNNEYAIYWKMLKIGLPIGAVKNACVRDGKNPSIMDLDPEKSLTLQLDQDKKCDEKEMFVSLLEDDQKYAKYWKMIKVGLPVVAVKNCCIRDGEDPSMLDLDPEKVFKLQTECRLQSEKSNPTYWESCPTVKDDDDYVIVNQVENYLYEELQQERVVFKVFDQGWTAVDCVSEQLRSSRKYFSIAS